MTFITVWVSFTIGTVFGAGVMAWLQISRLESANDAAPPRAKTKAK